MTFKIINKSAYKALEELESVDMVFTSPDPPEDQDDIFDLVILCKNIWSILKDTGSLWVELGDYHNEYGSMSLIPERFALLMERYNWVLRSKLVWHNLVIHHMKIEHDGKEIGSIYFGTQNYLKVIILILKSI